MKWLLVYVLSQSLFVLYDNLYIRTYKQDSVVLMILQYLMVIVI